MWDIIHVGLIKLGELVRYQPGRDNVNVGGGRVVEVHEIHTFFPQI